MNMKENLLIDEVQKNIMDGTENELEKKEWNDIGEEKEVWKDVISCNKYEVSNFGKIRNKKRKNILKPRDNGNGYKLFGIIENGKGKNIYIHRAVLESFNLIENYKNLEVNHKDFNRNNNKLENLEWIDHKPNMQLSFKNGNFRKRDKKRSEDFKKLADNGKHYWSKLNKKQVEEIYKLWITNEYTYKILGKKYGVTGTAIKFAVKRYENGRYD